MCIRDSYRTDETDDGLSGEEGTFAICSFWLVSALCEIGETRRARRLCEKLLSYASPLLLAPLVRFLPPDDERIVATVNAIAAELTVHGLVLRYRVEETDDGLGSQEEGTFTICSFWLVSALSEIGEHRRARELCERLLGFASPLGLYAEEIDARTGRHLGNFPQAFTHLALINAVMHVIRADSFADQRRGLVQARERERL